MNLRATLALFVATAVSLVGGQRVVSQTVGSDELLLAVARPDEVVALSHLANEPRFSAIAAQAEAFPRLSSTADAEAIVAFRPTLVLLADYSRAELRHQLEAAGIPVLVFARYATLEDCFANLRLLGDRIGPEARQRAEAVIADCQTRVARLADRLRDARPVRVIAPSTYGIIPGRDTTFDDLCRYAKADNLASSLGGLVGHAAQPSEQMLTWPIEALVLGEGEPEATVERLGTVPPYRYLAAVRERRFVTLLSWQLSCVSHHRVEGYERLARQLHPGFLP